MKNFLIAAGGTGMRCLQSFVNMCSMGMLPGESVSVLILETDIENGDKKNSENLMRWYKTISESSEQEGKGKVDSGEGASKAKEYDFFGNKLTLRVFVPDYSQDSKRRFTLISQLEKGDSTLNRELADQFYEEGVQEFDLMHGYRAQTHLGSYLMYHAIIEELKLAVESDLHRQSSTLFPFMSEIVEANKAGEARVFVVGSSFGGTGASSIPVMSRAISDGAKILVDGAIKMENIRFGAVILTPYFKFKPPSKEHKKKEKVIADSQFFKHNSAAALMYYIKDKTILNTYKTFYLLGWPFTDVDVDAYKNKLKGEGDGGKTITGGKAQENPAHILEFMSAFAARHFFVQFDGKTLESIHSTEVRNKVVPYNMEGENRKPYFRFDDLVSDKEGNKNSKIEDVLASNLTALYGFAQILKTYYGGKISNLLENLMRYNIQYNLSGVEMEAVDGYLNYLSYEVQDGKNIPGWLPQMWYSLADNEKGEFLGFNANSMDVMKADASAPKFFVNLYTQLKKKGVKKAEHVFFNRYTKLVPSRKDGKLKDLLLDVKMVLSSFEIALIDPSAN